MLMWPIDMIEVEEVIHQMAEIKASDLDGFTTNFFHHYWYLVKEYEL